MKIGDSLLCKKTKVDFFRSDEYYDIYNFHGIDMVDIRKHKLDLPGFKPLKTRMSTSEYILRKLSENYDLLRVDEIIKKER